jgi:hypothetical protein
MGLGQPQLILAIILVVVRPIEDLLPVFPNPFVGQKHTPQSARFLS